MDQWFADDPNEDPDKDVFETYALLYSDEQHPPFDDPAKHNSATPCAVIVYFPKRSFGNCGTLSGFSQARRRLVRSGRLE
jgi:hypothetical protein